MLVSNYTKYHSLLLILSWLQFYPHKCLCAARHGASSSLSFPRVSVINLERSSTRKQQMLEVLSKEHISFEWCIAVDGTCLTGQELSQNATRFGRYFMTDGMIGCFLSHRKCWKRCLELNRPLLVFEDDVILQENFKAIVNKALNALDDSKQNWDVLLLGALGCVHPYKKFGLNIAASLVGGKWRKMKHIANVCLSNKTVSPRSKESFLHIPLCPYGMHAYILTPNGARKLLKRFNKATFHVDVAAWGLRDLDLIALHPLVAWQTNEDTTIGGFVHVWKRFFPTVITDQYTRFEIGWALSAPLLRIGGQYFPKLLLTNGTSLLIMFLGAVVGVCLQSQVVLGMTIGYVVAVTCLIRFLSSQWNK